MLRKCKLFSHIAILLIGILVLVIESPLPANAYRGEETAEVISLSGEAETEDMLQTLVLDQSLQSKGQAFSVKEQAESDMPESISQPELLEKFSQQKVSEDGVTVEAGNPEAADAGTEVQSLEELFGTAENIVKKIEDAKALEQAAKEEKERKAKEKKAKEKKEKSETLEVLDESRTAGRTLKKRKAITLSAKELDCLQRIVQAEAGNEDIMGKLLVANVVLNRYRNKQFPNSIEEIVTQTSYGAYGLVYQFTPTRPGGGYWSAVPSEETIEAVQRALNGEDYSEGALYFASRSGANPTHMSWFDRKLTWLFKHGNHEFYVG